MATSKNLPRAAKAASTLYAGKLPATKKPGETLREKCVRRALRAAKALDAANAKLDARPGEVEGYAKKYEGTLLRLRERVALDGIEDRKTLAPANPYEVAAFALAGIGAPVKAAKPPRAKKPAKVADAPVADAVADASAMAS